MKKADSSLTSLISAFGRAYHSLYDSPKIFNDYIAKEFILDEEFNAIKENMVQGIPFFNKDIAEKFENNSEEILKWITQVQLSPITLSRAAYCENVLQNEITLGIKQYVILGAGLDTFSFRHPNFEHSLEIFEIDHPATQRFKKQRLDHVNLQIPKNLHFVDMDFTKNLSYQKLMDKGFENKRTFFSLLGVSYYLTKEEITRLIDSLFSLVPSGSSIVFDYADDTLFEEKGLSNRVENMVNMATMSGEPMKSCFAYQEIEKLLEKSGLLIYEHLSPAQIQDLYFHNRHDYLCAFETIHFIHALKK